MMCFLRLLIMLFIWVIMMCLMLVFGKVFFRVFVKLVRMKIVDDLELFSWCFNLCIV